MKNKNHKNKFKISSLFLSFILALSLIFTPFQEIKASTIIQTWGPLTTSGTFTVPVSGTYQLEAWGSKGDKGLPWGGNGGNGGYASGEIYLTAGTVLYYNINNDGGAKGGSSGNGSSGNGGGSADFRLNGTTLNHRILVGAGGGGGPNINYWRGLDGGGLSGEGAGGSQTMGGKGGCPPGGLPGADGSFGRGGGGAFQNNNSGGGGGGGWYGGCGGGTEQAAASFGGSGGSSYYGTLANPSTTSGVNAGAAKLSISLLADTTPPTAPTITANYANPSNQNVVLTLASTDDSGIQTYQFYNGTSWVNCGSTYTVTTEGNTTLSFRAVDTKGNISAASNYTTTIDKTNPKATSSLITNVTSTGYDVYIYGVADPLNSSNGTASSGIARVQFPTWTSFNGQDDIQPLWTTNPAATGVNQGGGTWYFRVNMSSHNSEYGLYNTHVYIYDNAGNSICVATLTSTVYSTPTLNIITPPNNIIYSN